MKRYALLFGMALTGIGWAYGSASAQVYSPQNALGGSDRDPQSGFGGAAVQAYSPQDPPQMPASCEPGFTYVQAVEYKEIEHTFCKRVPDKRTKWVYCSKPAIYCLSPLCGHHHKHDCDGGDCCQDCKERHCRRTLWKKKVEWECGTKCVVETVKEKVPCTVWRKVPIGTEQSVPGQAPEALPPPKESAPSRAPESLPPPKESVPSQAPEALPRSDQYTAPGEPSR
jgi:hypothetical protein